LTVQGKWNITIKTPVGDKTGVLDLVVDGPKLSGSLYDAEHFAAISDGKVDGNRLTWSAQITKPMRLSLKFSATVNANDIEGSAKHFLGSVSFRGSRA
jgi:hypothetical protein